MIILKSVLIIAANLIIYTLLGSLVFNKKSGKLRLGLCLITGFFLYYTAVFLVCFPFMIKYRPLTWFIAAFSAALCVLLAAALFINFKRLKAAALELICKIKSHPYITLFLLLIIFIQVILVTTAYNFTLDAAYYVSNVTTSLDTNMINVYDPFTGAWQDHYEVRYLFATYSINDAFVCFLTKIPALVQTKLVMSATVIIIVNILYFMIAAYLFKNAERDNTGISCEKSGVTLHKAVVMVYFMFFVNCTFNTIFTSSLFLLTRTYEGKTVIGNLSLLSIFYIFMLMLSDKESKTDASHDDALIYAPWLVIFIISLGSMTISSSANMLIPAELSLLFIPYMLIKKTIKPLLKYIMCMLPGIAMVLIYVLYVKGYFVFYTYPR